MKTLRLMLAIYVALQFVAPPHSFGQTLVTGYNPKVAGSPYHRLIADHEGNILVYGHFDQVDGEYVGNLAKLDAEGDMIAEFHQVITDGNITDAHCQQDGKILISGDFTTVDGRPTPNLVRLNTDGTLDLSFTSALEHRAGQFALQHDDKVIATESTGLVRLNSDGTIDASFSMTGSFNLYGPMDVGADDYIYITTYSEIYRLKPNGEDDTDFYVGSGVNENYISAIEVQSDGKVIIAGMFTDYNGVAANSLVRLLPNGDVDPEFSAGAGPGGLIFQIVERSNKNILIGGQFAEYGQQPAGLVELKPDGRLHKIIATVTPNSITSITEGPDQKFTLGGGFVMVNGLERPFLVKFNTDYTINKSFDPLVTYNNPNGRFLEVKENGKVLTGAYLDFHGLLQGSQVIKKEIVQMNQLGSYDNSFNFRVPGSDPFIVSCAVQEDGKILLGGFVQGFEERYIVRLNADGSKDNSFVIGTGPATNSNIAGFPYKMKAKGNLLYIAGNFEKFNGVASQSIVMLDLTGAIVQTFSGLPAGSQINDLDLQSDGRVIVVGLFPYGSEFKRVARFDGDGTLDESFAITDAIGNVLAVRTDELDRIYLAGSSMTLNGALANSLVRLLPDGNIDPSFDIGLGFDDIVYAVEPLPGGNIAAGGQFKEYDNEEANGFVILGQDGTRVSAPLAEIGKKSLIIEMKCSNGALYLGGRVVKHDYSDVYGTAKIAMDPVTLPADPDNLSVVLSSDGVFQLAWNDNSSNELAFILERAIDEESGFEPYDTLDANRVVTLDSEVDPYISYSYRLRAVSDGGKSAYTNTASITWVKAPDAALDLTVTEQNENELLLTWVGSVSHHDGFIIERSTSLQASYTVLDTVDANTYSYVDAVEPEHTYFYKVAAYNKGGRTVSNEVSLLVSGAGFPETSTFVYPVPANASLFTKTSGEHPAGEWRFVSSTGRYIDLTCSEISDGIGVIDVRRIPPGIYLAQYLSGQRILFSKRVVIDH